MGGVEDTKRLKSENGHRIILKRRQQ